MNNLLKQSNNNTTINNRLTDTISSYDSIFKASKQASPSLQAVYRFDSQKLTGVKIDFYPRDAMLARVFAIATCPSVRPSVCLSVRPPRAGIVPSRAKAGS